MTTLADIHRAAETTVSTDRKPTVSQWAALDRAARYQNGHVTEERGRGATRRLPALRRNGWVDDRDYLTPAGRAVAAGWTYDTTTGEFRRTDDAA